ncbi:MAG: sigma-54-dependent Fis family transcriptional regulator [candidate division Zixibacteria bacterium]|nr:sigma-54-dependent Fis family transcriptional regulator [Candidatus Tariuqbacter arcticus]
MNLSPKYVESLLSISQTLLSCKDPEILFQKILQIAMETLNAERGFLILYHGEEVGFNVRAVSDEKESISNLTEISQGAVEMVTRSGEPLLTKDASADPRFSGRKSVILHGIRSVACVPLKIGEEVRGVMYMDSRGRQDLFTYDTIHYLTLIASYAALAIDNALDYNKLKEENLRWAGEIHRSYGFPGIIGESPAMKRVYDLIARILNADLPVLITGESGTGKELAARAIHYNSRRKDHPFIALFCGNLSPELLESELFGHTKGAFTGAVANKKGLVEQAHGGSLMLDEIADLPPAIQAKLLRFLQESEYRPVGDNVTRKADVRIIAATNKEMKTEVAEKRFRPDLYWRLNVLTIQLPPLSERREDIPLLAANFLRKYGEKVGRTDITISKEALKILQDRNWPGNVRELENAIARAVVFAQESRITPQFLFLDDDDFNAPAPMEDDSDPTLKSAIRRHTLKILQQSGGNRSEAVRRLGISRRYLYNILEEIRAEGIEF